MKKFQIISPFEGEMSDQFAVGTIVYMQEQGTGCRFGTDPDEPFAIMTGKANFQRHTIPVINIKITFLDINQYVVGAIEFENLEEFENFNPAEFRLKNKDQFGIATTARVDSSIQSIDGIRYEFLDK
jgi:hypothetical protein